MTSSRRATWNHGLDRAVDWARQLDRPLVILEALRCGYRWASDRFHRFLLQGMADNARDFRSARASYYPYVEPSPGAGSGLLEALAGRACVVVTDEFPCFFLPRMVAAAARRTPVRLEAVDGNGLLPLRASDRAFETAYSFRRHLQKTLPAYLDDVPREKPFAGKPLRRLPELPPEITRRWPAAGPEILEASTQALATIPVDHAVGPAPARGGSRAGRAALESFVRMRLDRYAEARNDPGADATSGLSPYLHFGHVSAHEVFARVASHEGWNPLRLASKATGSRQGWWGMAPSAESFLDEAVTWREVGYNMCALRTDYDQYESLPPWARRSLEAHASDPRRHTYSLDDFANAATHDPLWNAAQTQLRQEGKIHNYLRMLWGKKILEWSPDPRTALDVLVELNNRFALDGRNPNSYSGIFWTLGRYDRPWGPERPIFGTVRYMSSENTARKLDVKGYIATYSGAALFSPPGDPARS
jgi:deoxyribodipyrimidine photo-lyase